MQPFDHKITIIKSPLHKAYSHYYSRYCNRGGSSTFLLGVREDSYQLLHRKPKLDRGQGTCLSKWQYGQRGRQKPPAMDIKQQLKWSPCILLSRLAARCPRDMQMAVSLLLMGMENPSTQSALKWTCF